MRMLQWMSGHTLRDRNRNENIKKGLKVANIEEKMKENRLRWFRWGISKLVRTIEVGARQTPKRARKAEDNLQDRNGKAYE